MGAMRADVAVIGGGLGGVAAALAAAKMGRSVIMTEESPWIGGQLTSQGVPPDEHPWIEQFGCTESYRTMRDSIRDYYLRWYPLTTKASSSRWFNPGAATVSKLSSEPRVGLAVLRGMIAPYLSAGRLRVLLNHSPISVATEGDRIVGVSVLGENDDTVDIEAEFYIDATELGDLLALGGVEHVKGSEARSETGEPHAGETASPDNIQAISWCFAIEHHEGEDHTIDRPEGYEQWSTATLPGWPGPMLSWTVTHPRTMQPATLDFEPNPDGDPALVVADQSQHSGIENLWIFRRIIARRQFNEGAYSSDISMVNWPMIDFVDGSVLDDDRSVLESAWRGARSQSESFLYWIQTEAPRADGGTGFPGIRLRDDIFGTDHGFAVRPYIRESRRIRAVTTIVEQDLASAVRGGDGAVGYRDSIGVGMYRIDLHPSTGGDCYIDVEAEPFEIPLGALIPARVENLIAGSKNIGTTHITNGAYRLHPVEWNIGEVAGLVAAHSVERGLVPHAVQSDANRLDTFQRLVAAHGIEIHWPNVQGY